MNVLVIDDNPELRDLVRRALERDGNVVRVASTAAEADALVSDETPAVIVLDLALPDAWGSDWCRRHRREGLASMVLTLTANASVARRIDAFDAGVDDFLAKPFAIAELRARVRALGRRGAQTRPTVLHVGHVELDFAARRASANGIGAVLTAREWSVLDRLASARGGVVARDTLLEDVWGIASDSNGASLEVIVGRIRKKLGAAIVRTVRGDGYALEA